MSRRSLYPKVCLGYGVSRSRLGERKGCDHQVAAGSGGRESIQRSRPRHTMTSFPSIQGGPEGFLVSPANPPHEIGAPDLILACGIETERRPGNGHFHRPTGILVDGLRSNGDDVNDFLERLEIRRVSRVDG